MARNVTAGDIVFALVKYLTILFIAGMIVLPFLYVISVSFRTPTELLTGETYLIPKNPTLNSWTSAFESLATPLKNSFLIASGTTVLALLITIPGAYVFGRKEFPGKRPAFYAIVVALMFPYILLVIPISDIWFVLGLYDTIPGMWFAYQVFVTPFALWILRDFFEKLPANLEEAAQVYGCTQFGAFRKVILPLSLPAVAAVAFLAFLTGWNDFLFSNMLTTGTGPRPAVPVLFLTTTGGETNDWSLIMAQTLTIGTPPTVLYLVSRKYLTQSFAISS